MGLWHYSKGLIIPGESTGGWRLTVETRERTLPGLLSAALHLYSPEDLLGENKNGKYYLNISFILDNNFHQEYRFYLR